MRTTVNSERQDVARGCGPARGSPARDQADGAQAAHRARLEGGVRRAGWGALTASMNSSDSLGGS